MQPTLNSSPYQPAPFSPFTQPAPLLDSSPEGVPGYDRYVFTPAPHVHPSNCARGNFLLCSDSAEKNYVKFAGKFSKNI
jgi:hypothetical protein